MTIYDYEREIARYVHSFRRGQTFGAEWFEKELLDKLPGAERTRTQQRFIATVGPAAKPPSRTTLTRTAGRTGE